MKTNNIDINEIITSVENYFKGTYEADPKKLQQAFHPDAHITGMIAGQYYDWTLNQFIERVISNNAEAAQDIYDKNILSIDQSGCAAIVKAKVKVGKLFFIDYITLLKINDSWIIRHKSFTATE